MQDCRCTSQESTWKTGSSAGGKGMEDRAETLPCRVVHKMTKYLLGEAQSGYIWHPSVISASRRDSFRCRSMHDLITHLQWPWRLSFKLQKKSIFLWIKCESFYLYTFTCKYNGEQYTVWTLQQAIERLLTQSIEWVKRIANPWKLIAISTIRYKV